MMSKQEVNNLYNEVKGMLYEGFTSVDDIMARYLVTFSFANTMLNRLVRNPPEGYVAIVRFNGDKIAYRYLPIGHNWYKEFGVRLDKNTRVLKHKR